MDSPSVHLLFSRVPSRPRKIPFCSFRFKVCCGLEHSASFTLSFEQDDEITVLVQTPDLDDFFLVCIAMDVASITLSNPILFRATARALSPMTLPAYQTFLTTRKLEFAHQRPLSLQTRLDRARTACSGSTNGYPHHLLWAHPPLLVFHLPRTTPTPILQLFHPQRQTLTICVVIIIFARPTFSCGDQIQVILPVKLTAGC